MNRPAAMLCAAILAGSPAAGRAAITPEPGPGDPRIRVVHFDPNEVIELQGAPGYQMTIEFGPGERIENVSIGDGLGWQVTPNHKANLLFLKPLDVRSATDMTVITNLRRYVFDLSARRAHRRTDPALIFRLRFEYPEPYVAIAEPKPLPAPPKELNRAYSFQGAVTGRPTKVFDDGRATYFAFAATSDYPAIFAVGPDRKEAVVNTAMRDGYVVVDRLAAAFLLKRGPDVTRVINDAWPADPISVKHHKGLFR